jgi:hypothetical protein
LGRILLLLLSAGGGAGSGSSKSRLVGKGDRWLLGAIRLLCEVDYGGLSL